MPLRVMSLLGILACLTAEAKGAPVVWKLTGQVQGVYSAGAEPAVPIDNPALTSLGVVPGAPFTATIVVEPTTADSDGAPDFANFLNGVLAMSFSAGGYNVSESVGPDPVWSQLVVNVAFQVMIANISAGPPSMFTPTFGLEVLADVPGTFTDAMPTDPPPLASLHPFDRADPLLGFGTSFAVIPQEGQIRGSLSSWVRVPEPAPSWLVLAAAIAIGFSPAALRSRSARAAAAGRRGS